ncbi:MAG: NADH:flavin oxidoreductase [Deltaproteobacteria bacterium]|nr:MAG: NADH:flavin oxidoreductase [Deltaproteobacteria bacterium]
MREIKLRRIFEPIKVGSIVLKNRMVMAPVVVNAANVDGTVSDKMLRYYQKRARGFGLVIVESTNMKPGGEITTHQLQIFDDRFVDGLQKLSQAIQSAGTRGIIQINHGGAKCIPTYPGQTFVSASDVPITHGQIPRSMSIPEIRELVRGFGDAAERAIKAGFDGVEIQGCHFYLLSQFLSPYSNKREDEYGRNIRGRTRFLQEVAQEIRARIGAEHILSCRINGIEEIENGLTTQAIKQIAEILEASGVDTLNISGVKRGIDVTYEGKAFKRLVSFLTEEDPPGYFVPFGFEIKKAVNIPVMVVGKIFDPYMAERILQEEKADMIAFGRQIIANAGFAQMIIEGRIDDIRECNECFVCLNTLLEGKPIECPVNPDLWT